MANFFNVDNKFFTTINKGIDLMLLGILWIVTSGIWAPVIVLTINLAAEMGAWTYIFTVASCVLTFPMGASSCALYATIIRCIKYNWSYPTKEYFKAFKSNFRQATPLYGIWFAFMLFLSMDVYITKGWIASGQALGFMFYTSLIFMALGLCWFWFLFAYVSRFHCTKKEAAKFTIIITFANIHWSIALLATFILGVLASLKVPVAMLFFPGLFAGLQTVIEEKVFRKYRSEEDIQKELENNRDFSDMR